MTPDTIKKIAVIGSGAMGRGIAQVFAMAGYAVSIKDIDPSFLENAVADIKASLTILVGKGKITGEDRGRILSETLTTTLDTAQAVQAADIIIEAVPENMALKKKIFREISDKAKKEAIIATNTSTMSVTALAGAVDNPEHFAGMHFFNPANRMKLVEIIYGAKTSAATADTLVAVCKVIKKIPVKVLKDRPGFIVNRISAPNQALLSAILDEGKIKPDMLDTVMRRMGLPMGPFELADYVGIDVFCHTMSYYAETLSEDYKPGKYLCAKLDKNELGMKTGQGIYAWKEGKSQVDTSKETSDISPMDLLALQMNEALRVYKEGIAGSVKDIDNGVVHGMKAFAGPFAICKNTDHTELANALNRLYERYQLSIFKPEPEIVDGSFKTLT